MVSEEHAADEGNCASDDEPEVVITGQTTCNTPKRKNVNTGKKGINYFPKLHAYRHFHQKIKKHSPVAGSEFAQILQMDSYTE